MKNNHSSGIKNFQFGSKKTPYGTGSEFFTNTVLEGNTVILPRTCKKINPESRCAGSSLKMVNFNLGKSKHIENSKKMFKM